MSLWSGKLASTFKKKKQNDKPAPGLIMLAFAVSLSIDFMHRSLIQAIIVADLFTSVAESTYTRAAQASAAHTDTHCFSQRDVKPMI